MSERRSFTAPPACVPGASDGRSHPMRTTLALSLLLTLAVVTPTAADDDAPKTLHTSGLALKTLEGEPFDLSKLEGKVVLFVNVASQCGLTPQYEKLEALHRRFKDRGLVIVGVPANDFGQQEPGTAEEIREFCRSRYQ